MSGLRGPGGARAPVPRAKLPLLDRLLDSDPDTKDAPVLSAAAAVEALRNAVRRDLEALLNARRRRLPLPQHLQELVHSPVNYGLPDPTSGAYAIPERRAALARDVEATLRRFEPRLQIVSVTLLDRDDDDLVRALRVKVDGILRADPVPEPITFETLVEPVSRDVVVRES